MKEPILSDLYTCQLLKLYYKLYRNRLPSYFEIFLPEYGAHRHEFEEMNAKYQMQLRLRDLASPANHQNIYQSTSMKIPWVLLCIDFLLT